MVVQRPRIVVDDQLQAVIGAETVEQLWDDLVAR